MIFPIPYKTILILSLVLFFLSCQEKTPILPLGDREAREIAAMIRRDPLKPHNHILSLFEQSNQVELVDYPGYTGVVDLLEYLMPLLYDRGIKEYSLWFIPEDALEQANAILGASRFFSFSAAELIGRVSYLYQFQEYVDFLDAIYKFNKTLGPESQPIKLVNRTSPDSGATLILSRDSPKTMNSPVLFVQSPLLFESLEKNGDMAARAGIDQVSAYLKEGENLFVINGELGQRLIKSQLSLIMLTKPGSLTLCRPFKGGITPENAETALKDFPEIRITHPLAAVPLMERAQRKFLSGLSDS